MKCLIIFSFVFLFFSCSNTPFVNHKLTATKTGDCNSDAAPAKVNVISNINGERFEFESCLGENFDSKNYTVERTGDSLFVKLQPATNNSLALYKIVLDIDAKPAYRYISINGLGINMKPAERL